MFSLSNDALRISLDRFISVENRQSLRRIIKSMFVIELTQRPSAMELHPLFVCLVSGRCHPKPGNGIRAQPTEAAAIADHMPSATPSSPQQPQPNDTRTEGRALTDLDSLRNCAQIGCESRVSVMGFGYGLVACAAENSSVVELWEVGGRPRFALCGHSGLVRALAVGRNLVASAGQDGRVIGWDGPSGRINFVFEAGSVTALDLSSNCELLAYGNAMGHIYIMSRYYSRPGLFDEAEGKAIWTGFSWLTKSHRHHSPIDVLKFDRSSKRILSSSFDEVFVWNVSNGWKLKHVLRGYRWNGDFLSGVAFDQWMVRVTSVLSATEKVQILDTGSGKLGAEAQARNWTRSWNYTPCGRYKVSLCEDGRSWILKGDQEDRADLSRS
jgi:WD40 repeat protein